MSDSVDLYDPSARELLPANFERENHSCQLVGQRVLLWEPYVSRYGSA